MANNFQSKYNIGQSVAEGIYLDITIAFNLLEKAHFNKAFTKFKTIKGKIPANKISSLAKKKFKALDKLYDEYYKASDRVKMYKVITKYSEILLDQLDTHNMYLPSMRDTSHFT